MREIIELYFNKLKNTLDKIDRREIETFVSLLNKARDNGNTIYIMGNGGSGTTSSHYCCDFNKVASYGVEDKKRFRFVCLNDYVSTVTAYSNDVCYEDVFVEQLKNFLKPDDVVIGLSGSGNSKNILKAIEYANENKAITIGLTGFVNGKLKDVAQYSVNPNIDDIQVSEDIHLILCHMIMQYLREDLR